jgi:predicted TIM-barrel fold metal-dependent hydrolase
MFAADYPFEQSAEAGEFLDKTPLAESVRGEIAFKNAVREFKLPAP